MKNSSEPSVHRDRERAFMEHVQRLLGDERLRIDTTAGRRPVASLLVQTHADDKGTDLKRQMAEAGKPDRELERQMPLGQTLSVSVSQKRWFFFKKQVGKLEVICVSPTRELLAGEAPQPLTTAAINKLLSDPAKAIGQAPGKPEVPTTVVLMSTGGFTLEAHELAERRANRTLLLAEPNEAGGWSVFGPVETKALSDLFDPEAGESKRNRVREVVEEQTADLIGGGVSAEKIAARTQLPLQTVEAELKSYAGEHAGLAAKRIDGRLLLYREGSAAAIDAGGAIMPFWERIKGIFRREESVDKKIARLAGERAGLTSQRERSYDEIAAVERKEVELAKNFQGASALAQRRIATEISQLRKDIERRQQILSTIDKKINVISTGIHTLELQQHVDPEKLKTLEGIATSSEDVEVGMAALQQLDEDANASVSVHADLPDDVAAIMAELAGKSGAASDKGDAEKLAAVPASPSSAADRERQPATPAAPQRQRGQAEPG